MSLLLCICNCHSFLPRDAMRKLGHCCRPVSVRPSVTLVYCIQTAEDLVKLLSRPGRTMILVFTRATRSIARYMLRRRGWVAVLSQQVLCLND